MARKVRIDLSSPPPVPVEELPEVPAVQEESRPREPLPEKKTEKKTENKTRKTQKRRSVLPGVLAAAAVAALLLGIWWFTRSGEPQNEVPQDALSGTEQTASALELLKWTPDSGHEVELQWQPESCGLVLRDDSVGDFAQMPISIRDYRDQPVSAERYAVERSDETVTVKLPRDLAPGRYAVHTGVREELVAEFWLGSFNSWIPEKADIWLSDFVLCSRRHGQYLARFDEDAPLRGVWDEAEATRFDSPWRMCSGYDSETGAVILSQGDGALKFVVDQFVWITADGAVETEYVFRFENWYLTMNSEGVVSLSDRLDEGCIWMTANTRE